MSLLVATVDAVGLAAAGTGKTIVEVATGANIRGALVEWWCEFDGTSATAVPIKVELLRATAAITGTALTLRSRDGSSPLTGFSAIHSATAEGTPGEVLENHRVHPQSGYGKQYPLDREWLIPVSSFMRIRCTVPTGGTVVNATVGMVFEPSQ